MFEFLNPDAKFYDRGFKNFVNIFKQKGGGFPLAPKSSWEFHSFIGCHRRVTLCPLYQSFPCRLL
jgi:hypothetical protein